MSLLDGAWQVSRHATLSDVRQGWQLLEICGRAVSDREDVLSDAWKNGRVWLKLGEPLVRNVKPSAEEKRVAGVFLHFIEAVKPLYLVESQLQARRSVCQSCVGSPISSPWMRCQLGSEQTRRWSMMPAFNYIDLSAGGPGTVGAFTSTEQEGFSLQRGLLGHPPVLR